MNTASWLQTAVLSGLVGCAPVIGEVTTAPTETAIPHTKPPDECGAADLPLLAGNASYTGPERYQICLDEDDAGECPTGETAMLALREQLRRVARDEARHASLAWRTVSWLIEQHPELRDEARAMMRAHLNRPARDATNTEDTPHAHRIGALDPAERQSLYNHVDAQVIRPAAERILGPLEAVCAAA